MYKQSIVILAASFLLVIACSDGSEKLQGGNGKPHLSFDGRLIAIESVYCSKRMGRVTLRFDDGALYVSKREELPGYEAVLRFTSPERAEYVNRTNNDGFGEMLNTDGLDLDPDRGVQGNIRMIRSIVLYDPDRFPDATAKMMEVRAACPK